MKRGCLLILFSPLPREISTSRMLLREVRCLCFLFLCTFVFFQLCSRESSLFLSERDHYDLGAIERVFKSGDIVRVRLKSKRQRPSKLLSDWSGSHEILFVKGVVIEVKELSLNRKYHIHHDRLSNPLFSNSKSQSLFWEVSET